MAGKPRRYTVSCPWCKVGPQKTVLLLEDTELGKKRGGNIEGTPKKDFDTIPYFLEIADYEKAFLYVALK